MHARTVFSLLLASVLAGCGVESAPSPTTPADSVVAASANAPYLHASSDIDAGRYLVEVGSCHDCHTPGFMEHGMAVPEADWLTGTVIGFRGPWGTTYPKNLRLTVQQMDEEVWVQTLHTRQALPPMPWPAVNALSERDARAIYRYIRSLGPAGQPAPAIVPPGQEPLTPYIDFVPQHLERLNALPADTTTT